MIVYAYAGLPASGKTTHAIETSNSLGITLVDDAEPANVEAYLKTGFDFVITSPFFCFEESREHLEKLVAKYQYEIKWVAFENNPEQCRINATKRYNKPVSGFISYVSGAYTIPENAEILPVYSGEILDDKSKE